MLIFYKTRKTHKTQNYPGSMTQVLRRKDTFISTGQAAALCMVTPDTVLKWIKGGKLTASRTPGGHYRIRRVDVQQMIQPLQEEHENGNSKPFHYCWEYYADGDATRRDCLKCIVYRSRTKRCYEISGLPTEAGHSKLYCQESCDECDYYRTVLGQKKNVLVVTDDKELRTTLEEVAGSNGYNLQVTDCEYNCSMLLEGYRADYVILDCSMGVERTRQFAQHVAADPRIPFIKIILVGSRNQFPKACDKEVFATLETPFNRIVLAELISAQ